MITPSALEDLYDEHAQAVFGYLLNLTRDMRREGAATQDCCQIFRVDRNPLRAWHRFPLCSIARTLTGS